MRSTERFHRTLNNSLSETVLWSITYADFGTLTPYTLNFKPFEIVTYKTKR